VLHMYNLSTIIPKKNIHLTSFGNLIRNILRKILSLIFCDVVEVTTHK
jgi:hypothetical protein